MLHTVKKDIKKEMNKMKCSKCKEEILQYGKTTKNYWGSCDCSDWELVRCE